MPGEICTIQEQSEYLDEFYREQRELMEAIPPKPKSVEGETRLGQLDNGDIAEMLSYNPSGWDKFLRRRFGYQSDNDKYLRDLRDGWHNHIQKDNSPVGFLLGRGRVALIAFFDKVINHDSTLSRRYSYEVPVDHLNPNQPTAKGTESATQEYPFVPLLAIRAELENSNAKIQMLRPDQLPSQRDSYEPSMNIANASIKWLRQNWQNFWNDQSIVAIKTKKEELTSTHLRTKIGYIHPGQFVSFGHNEDRLISANGIIIETFSPWENPKLWLELTMQGRQNINSN